MGYRHLDYNEVWTVAVWTILDYKDIWTIAISDYFGLQGHLVCRSLDYYDKQTNNFQTLYSYISSFLGLFKPLYKKIHCTVQNSVNGCSLNDGVVFLRCSPNFDSPIKLVVQLN